MGCATAQDSEHGPHDSIAKARNDEIEKQLMQDQTMARKEVKLLLLGAKNSGKSKLVRQMWLTRRGGFNETERASYKEIIFLNMVHSMQIILESLTYLGIVLSPMNEAHRDILLSRPPLMKAGALPQDVANAVRVLWCDPAIKKAVQRSDEFPLSKNAAYYFNHVDRIGLPTYLPTDEDIFRSRFKTTGITETTFKVGELRYKFLDLGSQRGDLGKWIHCFDDVTALVFVVPLSDYDRMLPGGEGVTNRLTVALTLFGSICNSNSFSNTPILLFFNKVDLFAEKLTRRPLRNYFHDYKGGDNYEAAREYLFHRFVSLSRYTAKRQIRGHYTCDTDAGRMTFVISAVQDIILERNLRLSGLSKEKK